MSRRLGFDRARIARAVLLGSAFPLVMFIAWNALVQGVVDAGSSADPVAALIAAESGEAGAELSVAVQIFSFSAVVTSFVGFYYGMRGYVKDVLVESSASGLADDERILAAAVLVPPSILAAICVEINQRVGSWLRRAVRNRHSHAIEQVSRRWREVDVTIRHEGAVKF